MPSNETAKTELARKLRKRRRLIWTLVLIGFLALIVWALAFLPFLILTSSPPGTQSQTPSDQTYKLTVPGAHAVEHAGQAADLSSRRYYLSPATTKQTIQKGLSNTPSLAADHGMLFVYPDTQQRCFWMKDMHYNLDIIWADDAKKVTAIEYDVSPATYPNAFCHDGRYVIELNAGETMKAGLKQGHILDF